MNMQSISKGILTVLRGHGTSIKVTAAAETVAAVTKSDSTKLAPDCIGLWVGGTGNVVVTMWDGSTATFTAVPAGTRLDVSPMLVMNATTATAIVALY